MSSPSWQLIFHEAPIPIGFAVSVGVSSAKLLSGGSMNPARSLGPAVVSNTWHAHWIYWVAPLTASIVVGVLYKLIFLSKYLLEKNELVQNALQRREVHPLFTHGVSLHGNGTGLTTQVDGHATEKRNGHNV
jgi:hypothetical protein